MSEQTHYESIESFKGHAHQSVDPRCSICGKCLTPSRERCEPPFIHGWVAVAGCPLGHG